MSVPVELEGPGGLARVRARVAREGRGVMVLVGGSVELEDEAEDGKQRVSLGPSLDHPR